MLERMKLLSFVGLVVMIAGSGVLATAKDRAANAPFKYVAGTEKLPEGCQGALQVGDSALNFTCPGGSVSVPYSDITLMQYRPEVSRQVSKLKIKWEVKPPFTAPLISKKNRYFVIVYQQQGRTGGLVLDVPPLTMRPYLAEIDLKAGKRVEVKEYEEYN